MGPRAPPSPRVQMSIGRARFATRTYSSRVGALEFLVMDAVLEQLPAPQGDDGVDVTLIRWTLSLDPEARLDVLQGFADSVAELTDREQRA